MSPSNLDRLLQQLDAWQPFPRAALVYVDLRHMRSVNRLGDAGAGDAVISAAESVLAQWVGPGGHALRLWSNEFVAAKAIDNGETAVEEVTALRTRLTAIAYPSVLGDNCIAVSIGMVVVAAATPDWRAALRDAADACDAAKHRGLNQIVTQSPRPHGSDTLVNASHVLQFRRLRDQGRLELHPQPIMDITGPTPRLAKAEFLMRMQQDAQWMPLPGGTIETLEYFGLSSELDSLAVQMLLHWLNQHADVLDRLDGVTLNLSARSIADGHFMDHLYDEVCALHLPPGKLGFEITETAAIDHLDIAASLIEDFRGIGCNFSLDDFGSGLCSFAYLQTLPVTEVKIDGRFLRDVADNPVSQEIVRAIHQVARATGKKTVAEFVDEPRKLSVLKSLGVDYAQGWLFHPAIPSPRFLQLLRPPDARPA